MKLRSRRFLFVVVLAGLLAAAVAAGNGPKTPPAPTATKIAVGPNAAVLAQTGGVWFCPGFPPAIAHAGGRVTFANLGPGTAAVVVTDLTDSGKPTRSTLSVPARTVVTRTRDQLGAPGALTVEAFGGRVAVEEGIEARAALESVPCATESSSHWNFAAGSTLRGVQQWLVIDNPYASDARVDVTLRTSSGVLRPSSLQGYDVGRRSRVVVNIHDIAIRQDRVAVELDAEVGAVVAAQAMVYTPDAGTPGVAYSLGAPMSSTEFSFVGLVAPTSSTTVVAIANVGTNDAQVDLQATAESAKRTIAPVSLTIAQDSVVWVALGGCGAPSKACVSVPEGIRYSLDVRSEQNVQIVAQTLSRFDAPRAIVGTTTSPGGTAATRHWVFVRSRLQGERQTALSLFNPGAAAAVVSVTLVQGGSVQQRPALAKIKLAPGRSTTVVLVGGTKPSPIDAAFTVDANVPVFAERVIASGDEAAATVGVAAG